MGKRTPEQLDMMAAIVLESNTSHRGLALKYVRLLERFEASEASRAWAVDKLEKLEILHAEEPRPANKYLVASLREIRNALSDNPKLAGG
jgi:hypothetical protein